MCKVKNQLRVQMHQILEPQGTWGCHSRKAGAPANPWGLPGVDLVQRPEARLALILLCCKFWRQEMLAPGSRSCSCVARWWFWVTVPLLGYSSFLPSLLCFTVSPVLGPLCPSWHKPTCIPATSFRRHSPLTGVKVRLSLLVPCWTQALTQSCLQNVRIGAPSWHPALLPPVLQWENTHHPTFQVGCGPGYIPFPRAVLPAQHPLCHTIYVRMTCAVSQLQSFVGFHGNRCWFGKNMMHGKDFWALTLTASLVKETKEAVGGAKKPPWFSFWWGLALQFLCPQKPMANKPHRYWE